MTVLFIIFAILVGFFALTTLMSFIPVAHGIFRVCDFPRLQTFIASAALGIASFFLFEEGGLWLAAICLVIMLIQAPFILWFTPLWSKQSPDASGDEAGRKITVMTSNVKQSNREYDRVVGEAQERSPDILVLLEVDENWDEATRALEKEFRHVAGSIHDNGYGMKFFSRLPISDAVFRDMVMDGVPSYHCTVTLEDGADIRVLCIHPEPPVPYSDTIGRDAEIIEAAEAVKDSKLPVIVIGDLNDVAWSHSTRRFLRLTGLKDPRIGRGLYPSFHATSWVFRWPLDHLFHSPHFHLGKMMRLPHVGSDHLPMYYELHLTPQSDDGRDPEPTDGDLEEKNGLEEEAEELERDPVGSDWENDLEDK